MSHSSTQPSLVGRAFRAVIRSRERQAQRFVNAYLADRGITDFRKRR